MRLIVSILLLCVGGYALAQSGAPSTATDPLSGLLGASPIAIAILVTLSRGITVRVELPERVLDALDDGSGALVALAQSEAGVFARRRPRRGPPVALSDSESVEPVLTPPASGAPA